MSSMLYAGFVKIKHMMCLFATFQWVDIVRLYSDISLILILYMSIFGSCNKDFLNIVLPEHDIIRVIQRIHECFHPQDVSTQIGH